MLLFNLYFSFDSICDYCFEVVYVGAIHPKHLEIAKIYLEAGKSVLCEKPLCMNVKETEELIQLARSKNVFLMEGIWSRCIPAYKVVFHF